MSSAEEAQAVVYRRKNGGIGTFNQRLDLVLDLLVKRVSANVVNDAEDELSFGFLAYTALRQYIRSQRDGSTGVGAVLTSIE